MKFIPSTVYKKDFVQTITFLIKETYGIIDICCISLTIFKN